MLYGIPGSEKMNCNNNIFSYTKADPHEKLFCEIVLTLKITDFSNFFIYNIKINYCVVITVQKGFKCLQGVGCQKIVAFYIKLYYEYFYITTYFNVVLL